MCWQETPWSETYHKKSHLSDWGVVGETSLLFVKISLTISMNCLPPTSLHRARQTRIRWSYLYWWSYFHWWVKKVVTYWSTEGQPASWWTNYYHQRRQLVLENRTNKNHKNALLLEQSNNFIDISWLAQSPTNSKNKANSAENISNNPTQK